MPELDVRPLLGNGARMDALADGAADLILTSPPYYPPDVEPLLRAPRTAQRELEHVRAAVVRYALSFRPVFVECARVLRPGGVLIVQTKDLRYGGALVSLAHVHRDLAEGCGFALVTRLFWRRTRDPLRHGRVHASVARGLQVGGFVAADVEEFLVLSDADGPRSSGEVDLTEEEIRALHMPLWVLPASGGSRAHPHASPAPVIERLVRLYSRPGDLVVDPFAGGGTILRVARALGRRAMGWDIDPTWADPAPRPAEPALPAAGVGSGGALSEDVP